MPPRPRCTFPSCTNYASKDHVTCTSHRHAMPPTDKPTDFQRRLSDGTYVDQVGIRLTNMITDAAQIEGLDNELGALRLVLNMLLTTEQDPTRLASGVPKVTGAIVQILRAQRLLDDRQAESLNDAIATILEELQPS